MYTVYCILYRAQRDPVTISFQELKMIAQRKVPRPSESCWSLATKAGANLAARPWARPLMWALDSISTSQSKTS